MKADLAVIYVKRKKQDQLKFIDHRTKYRHTPMKTGLSNDGSTGTGFQTGSERITSFLAGTEALLGRPQSRVKRLHVYIFTKTGLEEIKNLVFK